MLREYFDKIMHIHRHHKRIIHTHVHKNVHHFSHALAYHLHIIHGSIVAMGFVVWILSTGMFASSALSKVAPNTSLEYPLKQVTTFACRQQMKPWSELPASCKVSLPIITNADYKRFENVGDYKSIYTVLRWATYPGQWDVDKGDHAGVDIASANGTPLYAVAHGIVTFAGTQAGYGNVVKIMFRYNNKTYHAVYGHMHGISVSRGDIVEKGQFIGELWNTGSTFGALWGNHVHFEINHDNGGRPAFYYAGCPALQTHTFTQITNNGLCRSYREQYSVDPILFIEQSRQRRIDVAVVHPSPSPQPPVSVTPPTAVTPSPVSPQTLSNNFLTLRPLRVQRLSSDAIEFLREWDVQIVAYSHESMNMKQQWSLTFYVTRKGTAQSYHGVLPVEFTLTSPNNGVSFAQTSVQHMTQGKHTVIFDTQRLGNTTIAISVWGQTLATVSIRVIQ